MSGQAGDGGAGDGGAGDGVSLRHDAVAIWQAGLEAVRSQRLVAAALSWDADRLHLGSCSLALSQIRRVAVVGGGKAGAGMAQAVEERLAALQEQWRSLEVFGWLNVPADCVSPLRWIHLHPGRPSGVNEPTEQGVMGTERILELVGSLGPGDLCLALLSGGGSALLPAPAGGLSLNDKLAVTRCLSAAGASIEQLNTVRKHLSRFKGGGLAAACRARWLVSLIISDVIGDPLEIIASGPTTPDSSTPQQALAILDQFDARNSGVPLRVWDYLRRQEAKPQTRKASPICEVHNEIIGNNATAVHAAAAEATRRGYQVQTRLATSPEGQAEQLGRQLAQEALQLQQQACTTGQPICLISGGEPVVTLPPAESRGQGGRNQHLALAALGVWLDYPAKPVCLVSGGTDGEDGPTDAAGAIVDSALVKRVGQNSHSDPRQAAEEVRQVLERADAYNYFRLRDALLITGPTHTNVMDVRVVVVGPEEHAMARHTAR